MPGKPTGASTHMPIVGVDSSRHEVQINYKAVPQQRLRCSYNAKRFIRFSISYIIKYQLC